MAKALFSNEDLGSFFLELSQLLHAGLATGDALALMASDDPNTASAAIIRDMSQKADGGESLASVLESSGAFPDYACAMAAAGEASGRSEEAILALSEYYDQRARLERQLRSALFQPLVLLGVLAVVTAVLLAWVLPVFNDVYRQLGSSLTGVAALLLGIGGFIRRFWPLIIGLLAAAAIVLYILSRRDGSRSRIMEALEGKGPFAGAESARLSQVLSLALQSGLNGEDAMLLAIRSSREGSSFRAKCKAALELLRGDKSLAAALAETELLSSADCRLLEAGYRSGCADTAMAKLAERLLERSEARLEARMSRIEPVLVIITGALVGLILLSVLLPLAQIMSSIG